MKKFLVVLVLVAASFQLFAEKEMILQGMVLNTSRKTTGTTTIERSFTSAGINIINFDTSFSKVGFYSNVSFLLPLTFDTKEDGTSVTGTPIEDYDSIKIDLDMLLGPGYNLELGPVDVLIGGGIHFNGVAFMANSYAIDPYLSYMLGAGGAATAKFKITDSFSLTGSLLAAYDFYEIYRIPTLNSTYKTEGNLTYAASVGLGFNY